MSDNTGGGMTKMIVTKREVPELSEMSGRMRLRGRDSGSRGRSDFVETTIKHPRERDVLGGLVLDKKIIGMKFNKCTIIFAKF